MAAHTALAGFLFEASDGLYGKRPRKRQDRDPGPGHRGAGREGLPWGQTHRVRPGPAKGPEGAPRRDRGRPRIPIRQKPGFPDPDKQGALMRAGYLKIVDHNGNPIPRQASYEAAQFGRRLSTWGTSSAHSTEEMTIIEIIFSPRLPGLHLVKICIDGDCEWEQGRLIPVVRDEMQKERLINFNNINQNYIIDSEGEVQFLAAS